MRGLVRTYAATLFVVAAIGGVLAVGGWLMLIS